MSWQRQDSTKPIVKESGYLHYVHSFRGFAILNIVAIHAFAIAVAIPVDWDLDKPSPLYVLNEMLLHDSTIYFALISGMLFSAILRSRGYLRFYRNKFLYVLFPHIFCTVIFSAVRWNTSGTGVLALPSDLADYLGSILPNLVRGEAQFTYWYIPVLLIIFAVTPLLSSLTRARSYAAVPVWIVMLTPLVFSRPPFEEGILQVNAGSVIYFSGAYTVGIFLGDGLEKRLYILSNWRGMMIVGAILTSALITVLMMNEIDRFGGFSLRESLFYVQKLCIAFLVILWLRGRAEKQPRWLTYFADAEFSIYFLHAFFILMLAHVLWDYLSNPDFQPWSTYLMGPIYLAVALSLSMLVVFTLRLFLGRHSRLIIGS